MLEILPLELLAPGENGRITEIDGDESLVTRLAEMGFRSGVEVRMIQPGCPCIIAIDNHRISFRGEEAATIFVTR